MSGSVKFKDILLIPNLISISRVLLLPVFIYYLSLGKEAFWITILLFGIIIVTDFLDGFLSRLLNMGSDLGKMLDPVADKIVIAAVAISLIVYKDFPLWYFIFLMVKDLFIMLGGIYLYKFKGHVVYANFWGKLTTVSLAVLVVHYLFSDYIFYPIDYPFIITVIISFISTISYFLEFLKLSKIDNRPKQ